VLRLVLGDALRVGVVATALALLVGTLALRALAAAGYLTLFGVRLSPTPSLPVLGGVVAGALGLTLLGALLATAALLAVPPAALLRGGRDG
jgi:hypothetical protein